VTLWRQVLDALSDDTLDDATREAIVPAAPPSSPSVAREGQQATPEAVLDTAFHEFSLLLTVEQARDALREVGRAHE
jgi:hypothetical protein